MSEPCAKPSKEYIEKARELYGDPILCWATNAAVQALIEMKTDNPSETVYLEWRKSSRLMFNNFPAILVHEELYNIYSELAEETNDNFILPEAKEKIKVKIDPDSIEISGKIKISDVARKYGLDVKKGRSKCPFHDGSNNTSFSLNDSKGLFKCFSCDVKGDIIKFVQLMENDKYK